MGKYIVTVFRSASENVELEVEAAGQDAAERLIADALDQPHRVDVDELAKLEEVRVLTHDFCGDDESSWEVG